MRIYYLEKPLRGRNLAFVKESLELAGAVEQIRVPYVFPATSPHASMSEETLEREQRLLRKHLQHAGVSRDHGKRIAFVAPSDVHWYALLVMAIQRETGALPYIIQTSQQRRAIGNPGSIRVIDAEYIANG